MAKKKEESSGILPLAAGVIAGVAGMYFLHGHGKVPTANRKKIKGYLVKAKGEVLEKVEKMKEANEEAYYNAIDTVIAKYNKLPEDQRAELDLLAKDMKKHWRAIVRDLGPKPKKKPVKKIVSAPETPSA
jgi:hypothetical protein